MNDDITDIRTETFQTDKPWHKRDIGCVMKMWRKSLNEQKENESHAPTLKCAAKEKTSSLQKENEISFDHLITRVIYIY